MEINYYIDKRYFGMSFKNSKIIDYDPSLKKFFNDFYELLQKKPKLKKKGHVEHFNSYDELYILSCKDHYVYFYNKDKVICLFEDDLKSIARAMSGYLDKKYKEWRLGKTNCGGSFSVPSFYT